MTSQPSPLALVPLKIPLGVELSTVVFDAICLPSVVAPWLSTAPVARTARMSAHPASVVGSGVVKLVPSVEYVSTHPAGAMTSHRERSTTFEGSIVCVIDCDARPD